MQESTLSLLQLPKRRYGAEVKLNNSKQCVSNYYPIQLGGKYSQIFQMSFDTEPAIPNDSRDLLYEVIRAIRKQVREKVELVSFAGKMLWGLKELPIPLNIKSQFMFEQSVHKFDVIIKPTKSISIDDLLKTPEGQVIVFQVFNNELKQILRERQMEELLRGKYFDKKEVQLKQTGLNILRGFKFTHCMLKTGLHLQIDVCSRVYRATNLLEDLTNSKSKDYAETLTGSSVLTNYGKRRTYRITKIDYKMSPQSKFYHEKKAGQVTFAEYYQESYGLKVTAKNQPMVEVVLRVEKLTTKEGVQTKEILGYLVPEFISLTGMSDEQRANYNTMKDIAPYTKLHPADRVQETTDLVTIMNDSGRIRVAPPRRINAFQLAQPYVKIFNNATLKNNGDGNMNIRQKLKITIPFKDYVICYSVGKNSKYDDGDADQLVDILNKASVAFGVKFSEPGFITCDTQINSWKSEIEKDIAKNGKPQIIILYFQPFEEKFYGELKRYITCELKLPCQGIKRKTILKSKNPMSAASKIIIQMNQKIGGTAWEIIPSEASKYAYKKRTMYGALAISKGKKGFTLAFVGTLDSTFTKVFSYCKTGYKSKENIAEKDLEAMFMNWAKNYVIANQAGPELIMIYREGLSKEQTKMQVPGELSALKRVIAKIGEKTKTANYNPEVLYMTVTTKNSARFFDFPQSMANNSNKFIPKVDNPNSGTVVFDELTLDQLYDFYMAAQRVTEGTCTPTHFLVVHNSSKMPQESIAQFTYEQCFNYYNWTGAVKVPAALQCANKLAKLVGEHIQSNVTEGEVLNTFFFL